MRTGNRPSALPIVQFCAAAGGLGEKHGAGRAAAMSSAWHARCAKEEGWEQKVALLTDDERDDIDSWHLPKDVDLGGVTLKYVEAAHEVPVAVSSWGVLCDFEDECLTRGYVDFAWVVQQDMGWGLEPVVYVADLKKSSRTQTDPMNLQNLFYGFALCMLYGARFFVPGLWYAEDAEWQWAQKWVEVDSEEGQKLWERVLAAANNTGDSYCTGAHCQKCYSRVFCQEYALPVMVAKELLGPIAEGKRPPPDEAGKLLRNLQSIETILERAKEQFKAMVREGMVVEDEGERWGEVMTAGRKTLSKKKLEEKLGDLGPFYEQGKPGSQFRWSKA